MIEHPTTATSPGYEPRTKMQAMLVATLRLYQKVLSPVTGNSCRFHPTCSHYAIGAICTHGSAWGLWLTARRLIRCNPLFDGGHDPVPTTVSIFSTK